LPVALAVLAQRQADAEVERYGHPQVPAGVILVMRPPMLDDPGGGDTAIVEGAELPEADLRILPDLEDLAPVEVEVEPADLRAPLLVAAGEPHPVEISPPLGEGKLGVAFRPGQMRRRLEDLPQLLPAHR